jgi:hypothetical protein
MSGIDYDISKVSNLSDMSVGSGVEGEKNIESALSNISDSAGEGVAVLGPSTLSLYQVLCNRVN